MSAPTPSYDTDRVWTLPNVISLLRLLGVPLFLWFVLGPHEDGWAVFVLMVAGATDFVDGRLARALRQISRLGQMLDPMADRLYIFAVLIGLGVRGVLPWWLVGVLVGRDVFLACLVPFLRTRGFTSLPVHFLGKLATFALLYALPLVLLGESPTIVGHACKVFGWASVVWGTFLYWWAAIVYAAQTARLLRTTPPARSNEA